MVRITHSKVSGKPQGQDPTRVYGNHWDEDHVVEGLAIGSDVQAHDATLDALSGKALTGSGDIVLGTSPNITTPTGIVKGDVGLGNVDNTSDANKPVSTAQAAAIAVVQSDIDTHEANTSNPHSVTKLQVGLGNVDNTSDASKPVSTAQATAIALKANTASPTFTGTPAAPTATAGTNTTQLATTAFVLANGSGSFIQAGTGAATRTMQDKARESVSVLDFGAVGNGTADDTSAIQAAITSLTAGGMVKFPRGTYKVTSQLNVAVSGVWLQGEGRGATTISSSASGHTIQIATGLSFVEIHDMTITRSSYPATSGQDGIHFTNLTERALVENVEVSRHWDGIRCGITSFSKLRANLINNCYANGIHVTNADGAGGLQWTLIDNLTQQCNGWGVLYEVPSGTASVGEIINQATFANKLGGMAFKGTDSSHAINAIRIHGGFIGQDGGDELFFDTYGASTQTISGMFIELAGTSTCGVDLGTAITNVGCGINLTANNTAVAVTDNNVLGNSLNGIQSSAARVQISDNNLRGNGAAGTVGSTSGIFVGAGNGLIVGNSSKAQAFGLFLAADGPHLAADNDLTENTTASFASGATLTNSVVFNNIPKAGNELGQIWATSTNDNARAGKVGEYVASTIALGSAVSLTSNTPANVTSISLTAGDWDVDAIAQFTGATTTVVSSQEASISLTSATLDYTGGKGVAITGSSSPYNQIVSTSAIGIPIPPIRLSLSATTTVYLVVRSIFTTSTSSAYGILRARRVR